MTAEQPAEQVGAGVVAVVLTGMGQDGLRGCDRLRAAGAQVIVQDEATSVVWGMPGAVAGAGLAHRVLPLPEIGPAVVGMVGGGAAAGSARGLTSPRLPADGGPGATGGAR